MESKTIKPKGGACCAVATYMNYYNKAKQDGTNNCFIGIQLFLQKYI